MIPISNTNASLTQLVECYLDKVKVTGSNPVRSTIIQLKPSKLFFHTQISNSKSRCNFYLNLATPLATHLTEEALQGQ